MSEEDNSSSREVPDRLGDYRLVRKVGEGAMGAVYEAIQESLNRRVAVKVLPRRSTSTEARERFLAEARAAARLDHPNIVRVISAGDEDGQYYYAMEFVEGAPLDAVLDSARRERLEEIDGTRVGQWVEARRHRCATPGVVRHDVGSTWARSYLEVVQSVAVQVASALAALHVAGIVHRDVKPGNVLLRPDGVAILTDFGLAWDPDRKALTSSDGVACTPSYCSPEQIHQRSPIGPQSDVFSFGVTLYELVTLRLPFPGATVAEVVGQILQSNPVPPFRVNARLPGQLRRVIETCLRKEPEQRFGSGKELFEALQTQDVHGRRRSEHPRRRAIALLIVLVAGLVAVLDWGVRGDAAQTVIPFPLLLSFERESAAGPAAGTPSPSRIADGRALFGAAWTSPTTDAPPLRLVRQLTELPAGDYFANIRYLELSVPMHGDLSLLCRVDGGPTTSISIWGAYLGGRYVWGPRELPFTVAGPDSVIELRVQESQAPSKYQIDALSVRRATDPPEPESWPEVVRRLAAVRRRGLRLPGSAASATLPFEDARLPDSGAAVGAWFLPSPAPSTTAIEGLGPDRRSVLLRLGLRDGRPYGELLDERGTSVVELGRVVAVEGGWHHVALAWTPRGAALWVDGVVVQERPCASKGERLRSCSSLRAVASGNQGGWLDDVVVLGGRVEVARLRTAMAIPPSPSAGLVAGWPLDRDLAESCSGRMGLTVGGAHLRTAAVLAK